MNLLISPHDDDNALFAAFTCIRERPLVVVVTDSWIQPNRGETGCSSDARHDETRRAGEVLGCPVVFLGIRDDSLTEEGVKEALSRFHGFETVYAPAIQGGNWQHDLIGRVAREIWPALIEYTTYTRTELWTVGSTEIVPTEEELALKNEALRCYTSQINLPATRPHFEAVLGKSEWLNR